MDYSQDSRIVMTLDAGGTNLKFSAIRGNRLVAGPIPLSTEARRRPNISSFDR